VALYARTVLVCTPKDSTVDVILYASIDAGVYRRATQLVGQKPVQRPRLSHGHALTARVVVCARLRPLSEVARHCRPNPSASAGTSLPDKPRPLPPLLPSS
jgi:hypothetical protein